MSAYFGLTFFGDAVVLVGGMALGVMFHDKLMTFYKGSEKFAQDLKTKAAAIEAKLAAVKAAVK